MVILASPHGVSKRKAQQLLLTVPSTPGALIHGRKKDGVQSGMYMPYGHDHDEWLAKKKSSSDSWKERQKEKREAGKRKSDDDSSDEPPKKKGGDDKAGKKLVLAKKMRSALTTKIQLGDEEAEDFIKGVLSEYDCETASATDSSKD